ncbi:Gfo/Idh/MocA family oxidoreductase [Paenibacillus sp. IB182496]|uniref:Gfo/Idh/MocA family oxidoreductase n=1 Tax=Paenibacillus sabuli TaxID=2772509 RepID=A0A927GQQ7_9BACL|nr:Gfo/Idh/MocA family oxidoreductase [Paenibacillus sabuli]MBD2844516.1 Gfo/Idh/MocA family oxidoreductase [Paenibacillus sabuli]
MRALVIGLGSIGRRHARILARIGCDVAAVSRSQAGTPGVYGNIGAAMRYWAPAYAVVATPTSAHGSALRELREAGYDGPVLVEKPLFAQPGELPPEQLEGVHVGYNLRFHPLLRQLRWRLRHQRVLTATLYVGQHLPHWRERDYRTCYSASRAQGGGVLRDLSHELDYACWLFGPWRALTARGGHYSGLEIDSDDVYGLMAETARCPLLQLHLNYLDRRARRFLLVHTEAHTYALDLIRGELQIDRDATINCGGTGTMEGTYAAQHRAMLRGGRGVCTAAQAAETVHMIEAAERAAAERRWVKR